MDFKNPEEIDEIVKKHRGKVILEAYKIDKNNKKVVLTLSLTKRGKIEKSLAVEVEKRKIPTLLKIIEENWNKIIKEQRPKVKILVEELKKENL